MSIKNILLIGAGGNLGPSILSALTSNPSFKISILTRHSSTSTFPPHLTTHRISDTYPSSELITAFTGQDAIICTIALASMGLQKSFIDAAIQAGVKRFVPSEFGGDTSNEKGAGLLPAFFRPKEEVVEYLKGKEGVLSWTAFVTGPFFDMAMTSGLMGFDIKDRKASIVGHGNDTWSSTMRETIGLAVKNAMMVPEKTANRYMYIDSFTVSQNQVLASFEKVTGEKWAVTHVDAEELKKDGVEKMGKGDFSGAMSLLKYISCVDGHGANYMNYADGADELLELPKQNLDEVLAAFVKG